MSTGEAAGGKGEEKHETTRSSDVAIRSLAYHRGSRGDRRVHTNPVHHSVWILGCHSRVRRARSGQRNGNLIPAVLVQSGRKEDPPSSRSTGSYSGAEEVQIWLAHPRGAMSGPCGLVIREAEQTQN